MTEPPKTSEVCETSDVLFLFTAKNNFIVKLASHWRPNGYPGDTPGSLPKI
ncbi:MAG: hypothetical protein ACOYYJ_01900 [Chloroflexota bacterium]